MRKYRYPLTVLALIVAMLACSLPDSWVDVGYDLPTLTPSATPIPLAILYVTKTGDDSHDCTTMATACLTIMAAVNKAPSGALINIGPGTYQESGPIADEGMIIRDKNLWVHGAGAPTAPTTIISGGNGRDALTVTGAAHAVIENVTVSGGGMSAGGNGFGLYVTGSATATLRDSVVQANANVGVRMLGNVSVILENVTITANNAGGISNELGNLTVRGSRIINNLTRPAVYSGGRVTISDTTIAGNHSITAGTAIFNATGGFLFLERSTISANRVSGTTPDLTVYNYTGAEMTVVNSTISGNGGTGIQTFGNLFIVYSTIVRNGASGLFANTISSAGLHLHIENSIIEENGGQDCAYQTGAAISFDLSGRILSDGSCNVISPGPFSPGTRSTDRFLGPLANNGGATQTHALLAGSPAIDAAEAPCLRTDQRGVVRPVGAGCDVGAFEYGASPAALVYATPEATKDDMFGLETPTPTQGLVYLPTPTVTPPSTLFSLSTNANCRKGPGTAYNVVTAFQTGTSLQATARNQDKTWLQVTIPTGAVCWLAISTLQPPGPVQGLPVLPAPPLPDTPVTFTDQATCVFKLKKMSVQLKWSIVLNASGYHIYRNGSLIATLGANVGSYEQDGLSPEHGLTYGIEAFNSNGVSGRLTTIVSACK